MTVNVGLMNKHRMKTFLMNQNLFKKCHLLLDQFNYPDFHATLLSKSPSKRPAQTIMPSPTKQAYNFFPLFS